MIATLESVASCADSSSEMRPPFQQAVACRVFPKETQSLFPEAFIGREAVALETATGKSPSAATETWFSVPQAAVHRRRRSSHKAAGPIYRWKLQSRSLQ
jgi:hypothetical protein